MCFMLTISVPKHVGPATEPLVATIGPLSVRATYGGWFSKNFLLGLSEEGGCSCSLMHDGDGAEPAGILRPDVLDKVGATLTSAARVIPGEFSFTAMWIGDKPDETISIALPSLTALVGRNELRKRTQYVVTPLEHRRPPSRQTAPRRGLTPCLLGRQ